MAEIYQLKSYQSGLKNMAQLYVIYEKLALQLISDKKKTCIKLSKVLLRLSFTENAK